MDHATLGRLIEATALAYRGLHASVVENTDRGTIQRPASLAQMEARYEGLGALAEQIIEIIVRHG